MVGKSVCDEQVTVRPAVIHRTGGAHYGSAIKRDSWDTLGSDLKAHATGIKDGMKVKIKSLCPGPGAEQYWRGWRGAHWRRHMACVKQHLKDF